MLYCQMCSKKHNLNGNTWMLLYGQFERLMSVKTNSERDEKTTYLERFTKCQQNVPLCLFGGTNCLISLFRQ